MAKQAARADLSSSDYDDETSSYPENVQPRPSTATTTTTAVDKKDSIKTYVNDLLTRHGLVDEEQSDSTEAEIKISTKKPPRGNYENISAFRQYYSNAEGTARTDAPRRQVLTSDDDQDLRDRTSTEQSDETGNELNLDPDPIIEQRESAEQRYKQKVYLRQLQPPTPQPIEIQVQEVMLRAPSPKPPIHVRVGKPEPRTPPPIVIKSAPPPAPPADSEEPIVYNKYVPPPRQPPQQIIIHRHPDLPPKPRPIIVEQWLPYKPAPKRIIKHSLPPEARRTPPAPHNVVVSYAKPRALIEVELVRLPIVKIDPRTYEDMVRDGPDRVAQHPSFRHERDFLAGDRMDPATAYRPENLDWRI